MNMKSINKIAWTLALIAALVSCVDDSPLEFDVEKPASIADMEYLNDYNALKTYVDRTANPNFKLGTGVSVSDYLAQGVMSRLVNSNFDEMTAGYEMKHGAVVKEDGTLNLANIVNFIANAKDAGISIYGHTLCWHANQNAKYLNSLLVDREIEVDPGDANKCLQATTPSANANIWDWQLNYVLPTPLTQGVEYTLKMRAKASSVFTVGFWRYDGSATNYGPDFTVGESWSESSITFTPSIDATMLQFNFGTFAGDLYFDDMVLTAKGSEENLISNGNFDDDVLTGWEKPGWHAYNFRVESVAGAPAKWWTNLVNNSNVESDDVTSYFATEVTVGPKPATIGAPGTGADGAGRAIVIKSGDTPENEWDTQFFVKAPKELEEGQPYRFSMMIKADKPATMNSQAHKNPGGYLHYAMVGSPNVTTEWQEYAISGIISGAQVGMNTIAFNLSVLNEANTYYFDDIVWEIEESGDKIPLTPQEKADTISWALENWIAGMMEVTKDYVKAWDVVNEPMDDGNPSEIKTGIGKTDMADDEFYWQDYLGKDYAVMAFNLAAQYGSPEDKLFINDYNLEYNLDKTQGLIDFVKYIEDEGARVDGIGTQMHISTDSDRDKIVEMFELLAETGKLIKISELDLGVGKKTNEATDEDYIEQADMYKFVLQKYFEIIPAAQRYGITIWSPADSPKGSSWRPEEPIGLWTEGLNRKHAYAGVADALAESE